MPILGVIRPGAAAAALATRNRRVGVIATPATVRSHAYFEAIKDENPAIEVYEHATPTLVPLVEAGDARRARGGGGRGRRARAAAGQRDAAGEFIFPLPPSARIDTLLLGCTHYPLLRSVIAASWASAWRSWTRRPRRRRRSSSCSRSTAWRPRARATAREPMRSATAMPARRVPARRAVHRQLTTGDVGRVPRRRRPAVRRRVRGRRGGRARGAAPMSDRADRSAGAAGAGATTASGRPASSSAGDRRGRDGPRPARRAAARRGPRRLAGGRARSRSAGSSARRAR